MASNMSLSENIKSFGMKQVIKYLDADPDKNIPRVIEWVEKFDKDQTILSSTVSLSAVNART